MLFGQIKAVYWVRKPCHQLGKMTFGGLMIRVLLLLKNNIWLRLQWIWFLKPKQWDGSSYLYKGRQLWLQIKMVAIDIAYLLDFYKVGHITMLIDSSLEIPGSGIPSRPPCNKYVSAVLCFTPKVKLTNISINYWHDPFFLDKYPIKVFDQIMVPQKVTFERWVLLKPFLLQPDLLELLVEWFSFQPLLFSEYSFSGLGHWRLRSIDVKVGVCLILRVWRFLCFFVDRGVALFLLILVRLFLYLLADVVLKGVGQIIGVREIETLVYLYLLEEIYVLFFVFFPHARNPLEKLYHLDIFDLVYLMITNFGNFLFLSDHNQIVALEKLNEAQYSASFFALGVLGKRDLILFNRLPWVPDFLANCIFEILKVSIETCFRENFNLLVNNIIKIKVETFHISPFFYSDYVVLLLKFVRGDDHKLSWWFSNLKFT